MHVLYCTCCKLATLEKLVGGVVGGVTGGIVLAIIIGFVFILIASKKRRHGVATVNLGPQKPGPQADGNGTEQVS